IQRRDILVPKYSSDLAERLLPHELLQGQVLLAHGARDRVFALLDRFVAAFLGEPLADLVPGPGALDKSKPVLAGTGIRVLRCENLDNVAAVQHSLQRNQTAINLGS